MLKKINQTKTQSFQTFNWSWSIRYRGKVPRIIINQVENNNIFIINNNLNIYKRYNYYNKKLTAPATSKPMKTKLSIKANAIIVLLNKPSRSSGLRLTAKLNAANKIPTPKAENATGNIAKPKTKTLNALIITIITIIFLILLNRNVLLIEKVVYF